MLLYSRCAGKQPGRNPAAKVRAVHKEIAAAHHENLLIFVDGQRSQSLWYWVSEAGKRYPREHIFMRARAETSSSQAGAMVFDLGDFDSTGNVPLLEVTDRLKAALDVERVTKKFYAEFQDSTSPFSTSSKASTTTATVAGTPPSCSTA